MSFLIVNSLYGSDSWGYIFLYCPVDEAIWIIMSFLTMQWNTEIKLFNIPSERGVYYTVPREYTD